MRELVESLREAAIADGFSLFGIAPAVQSTGFHDLVRWLDEGYAGEMDYLDNRRQAYRHPSSVLAGVKSLITLAVPYDASTIKAVPSGEGRLARYVWRGVDYHDEIHPKLKRLCQRISEARPDSHSRGVVDTAPLPEREFARLAGLGWRGKNTLLLNRLQGSYFFLACVLTDVELPYDQPHESSHCGSCTACLDSCPTDAFPEPGVLDASRCISYLTIEHRGPIEMELRAPIGDWLFGCDVCQEVCPWNRKPTRAAAPPDDPLASLDLEEMFALDDESFRTRFRKTPLWRTRRRGILRNAAIVLGNQRRRESTAALSRGLNDEEPVVRGAAAWALGQIGSKAAAAALSARQVSELDETVLREIGQAIQMLSST